VNSRDDMALRVDTSDTQAVFVRMLDAPAARVFHCWTRAREFTRWFGPREFSSPVCEIDTRHGGRWYIVQRSPEGVDYPLTGIYTRLEPTRRLACKVSSAEYPADWHATLCRLGGGASGAASDQMTWDVAFDEAGDRTRIAVTTFFATTAERDAHLRMGIVRGWEETLQRLNQRLCADD